MVKTWTFKYDEIQRLGNRIRTILDSYSSAQELNLRDTFMSFCINCASLIDWLKKDGIDSAELLNKNIYIDICRGVANGHKHYKISKYINSYNSTFYRTSSLSLFQSSTGCVDNSTNSLYQNPKDDIIVVQTQQGLFTIREIVDNSIITWNTFLDL